MDNTEEDNSDPMPKRSVLLPHDNVRKSKCGHMPEISDVKDWHKSRRSGCKVEQEPSAPLATYSYDLLPKEIVSSSIMRIRREESEVYSVCFCVFLLII
ncbi:hypothetical protein C0J52_14711 [Blattella germanica]|nr:hypothetical protein C0J52_14711 [Blattella germanica]